MILEERLRQMVAALSDEASILLPVSVVRGWLDDAGDDPLHDRTAAEVATLPDVQSLETAARTSAQMAHESTLPRPGWARGAAPKPPQSPANLRQVVAV